MQRNLDIDLTRIDNLKQLKIAEAKGDEDLKAVYVTSEVDMAKILEAKRLQRHPIDTRIAVLQLSNST